MTDAHPAAPSVAAVPPDRLKQWALCLQFFQALGAVTVAALAIYAYFFTNLPQELTRQYRTDIADAKEQLAELRHERISLVQEVNRTRDELAASTTRLVELQRNYSETEASLHAAQERVDEASQRLRQLASENEVAVSAQQVAARDLQAIRVSAERLKKELAALEVQRAEYLKSAIGTPLIMIGINVELKLAEIDRGLNEIRNLVDLPRWAEEERQFQSSLANFSPDERSAAIISRTRNRQVATRFYSVAPS